MKIEVTQEDIERGERASGSRCPVALALTRAIGAPCGVAIGKYSIGRRKEMFPLPELACEFYERFDRGKPVHPFTFEIDL